MFACVQVPTALAKIKRPLDPSPISSPCQPYLFSINMTQPQTSDFTAMRRLLSAALLMCLKLKHVLKRFARSQRCLAPCRTEPLMLSFVLLLFQIYPSPHTAAHCSTSNKKKKKYHIFGYHTTNPKCKHGHWHGASVNTSSC